MSVKDLLKAWDEAAQRAMETRPENEIPPEQFNSAAGLRVRSGLLAGGWVGTDDCYTIGCSTDACYTIGCPTTDGAVSC